MTTAIIVAWILWMHVPAKAEGIYLWVPQTGFETHVACVSFGSEKENKVSDEDSKKGYWYSCFPNGFDPRDANQKTR